MKAKKSLQKLTDSEAKINAMLELKEITQTDIDTLTNEEKRSLMKTFNDNYAEAKGIEKDRLWKQVEGISSLETRNQLWEHNHDSIMCDIANHIQEYGRIPSTTQIAKRGGLSRQTVHKHLKEFGTSPVYLEQQEQFKLLTSKVLARVYQFAVNGDIGAAKLYFNVMGCLNGGQTSKNTFVQNQQNNIQINNTVISQETVKHLNPEQLNEIETILKTALPEPVHSVSKGSNSLFNH